MRSRESLQPEALMREARAAEQSPRARVAVADADRVRWLRSALLGWMIVRNERARAGREPARALGAHPGFVLTGIDTAGGDALIAHGLLDPDAEPWTATALGDCTRHA